MQRSKSYYFIIDNLSADKGMLLKKGLLELSAVQDVKTDVYSGLVEVMANRKIGDAVQNACTLAGLNLRREVKKNEL